MSDTYPQSYVDALNVEIRTLREQLLSVTARNSRLYSALWKLLPWAQQYHQEHKIEILSWDIENAASVLKESK